MARQAEINKKLMNNEGTENPFKLWRELGETMTEHVTVIRHNKGLKQADEKIVELLDRYKQREPERQAASGPTPASRLRGR